jgi:hypothetical protein
MSEKLKSQVRILHVRAARKTKDGRVVDHKGSVTLAVVEFQDRYHVGAAFCAPDDAFSRRRGRQQAAGRAVAIVVGPPVPCTVRMREDPLGVLVPVLEFVGRTVRPYEGRNDIGNFDRWYPGFLEAVRDGHVLRGRR